MFKITFRTVMVRTETTHICNIFTHPSISVRGAANDTKARPKRRYTEAEDQQILQLRKERHTWPSIAGILDRSIRSLSRRYHEHTKSRDEVSPAKPSRRKPASEAMNLEILRMVENDGLSFHEIARRLGRHSSVVKRRYQSVCPPNQRSNGHGSSPYSEAEIETIASGIRQKNTLLEIAEALGNNRTSRGVESLISRVEYLRGLMPVVRRPFTQEEDDAIRTIGSNGVTQAQIARQLDRPQSSISRRHALAARTSKLELPTKVSKDTDVAGSDNEPSQRRDINSTTTGSNPTVPTTKVRKARPTDWTPEADRLLLARPPGEKLDWDKLSKLFPGRTPHAVRYRYSRLRSQPARRYGYALPASAQP